MTARLPGSARPLPHAAPVSTATTDFRIDIKTVEVHDPRLRRVMMHDSRSLAYESAPRNAPLPTAATLHRCTGAVWAQRVGCCTMCAACGMLITEPFYRPFRRFTLRQVEALYSEETRLDEAWFPGVWPPTDTGSSGIWSMKLLRRKGWISGYQHMFSLNAVLATIAGWDGVPGRPVSLGTWWWDSMDRPTKDNKIVKSPDAVKSGGHQYLAVGQNPDARTVRIRNSWSRSWGENGYVDMSWDTLGELLADDGDAITGVPLGVAA